MFVTRGGCEDVPPGELRRLSKGKGDWNWSREALSLHERLEEIGGSTRFILVVE